MSAREATDLVHKKIGFAEMWDVCAGLAGEIETGQQALVTAGLRGAPDPERMRRAEVLTAICRFIEITREIEPEFRALVARKRGWSTRGGRS